MTLELTPINSFFDWLKDSGTQAILILVGTIAACVAAAAAIYFGKKSLTKADLAKMEGNTAHLEDVRTSIANVDLRTKRQEEADELASRAMFVSITVTGEADAGQPLSVYLTGAEPNPHLTRVEFRSELGNVFGTSECIPTDNLFQYIARLPSDKLANWRNAGTALSLNTTRQMLRIWMRFDEHPREVYRDMAVTLTSGLRGGGKDAPGINVATIKIEGAV
jgi:hypothetical protein